MPDFLHGEPIYDSSQTCVEVFDLDGAETIYRLFCRRCPLDVTTADPDEVVYRFGRHYAIEAEGGILRPALYR